MIAASSSTDRHSLASPLELLVATKVVPPSSRPNVLARPHLLDQLERVWHAGLTVIAAPAGFGKTTLLLEWLRRHFHPIAWLNLDADDSQPGRFWTYVCGALQQAYPPLGRALLNPFEAPLADPRAAATAIINAIADYAEDVVLVLDDYHLVDSPAIQDAMTLLLQHLPARLHLVLLTRAAPPFPLAQLRARGQLVELQASDLRLTPHESQALLRDLLHLPLARADIARLAERTGGWVAGLHLAALALRGQDNPARFVRSIGGQIPSIADYLIDEVLGHQPAHVQSFLLQTALVDRMNGPLCAAITGRTDAPTLLAEVERSNLFVVPLEARPGWYQYHPFFAEALQLRITQMQPEEALAVHRRAAAWYEAHDMPAEAITHLLAANVLEAAADRLAEAADALWLRGDVSILLYWLEKLPETLIAARPALSAARTYALLGAGQNTAPLAGAAQAQPQLDEEGADTVPPDPNAVAMQVLMATMQDADPPTIELLHRALDWSLAAAGPPEASMALLNVGFAYCALGMVAPARVAFTQAQRASQRGGDIHGQLLAATFLAELLVLEGRLRQALPIYEQLVYTLAQQGERESPLASLPAIGMGMIWYEWNELDRALALVEQGVERALRGGRIDTVLNGQIALARIQQAIGDAEAATATMVQALAAARATQSSRLITYAAGQQAALALAQGDRAAANAWATAQGMHVDDELSYFRELEYQTYTQFLLAQGYPGEALTLLSRLHARAGAAGRLGNTLPMLIMMAQAHQARGDLAQAQERLLQALALAEPGGYLRQFVTGGPALIELLEQLRHRLAAESRAAHGRLLSYLERILRAARPVETAIAPIPALPTSAEHGAPRPPDGPDVPLSPRERDILRCIAAGKSNKQIARELGLTTGTVKWYIANMFSKLDVHSRTQALARAQALGLVIETRGTEPPHRA